MDRTASRPASLPPRTRAYWACAATPRQADCARPSMPAPRKPPSIGCAASWPISPLAPDSMHRPAPLTPTALRTRWALADLATGARRGCAADPRRAAASVTAMGLQFPSPLALAAGFDRHGVLIGRAGLLGLGSVEIGSVSADSRELARALLGLRRCNGRSGAIHGISVIKRPATPWAGAAADFLAVLRQLHGLADYVALNPGRGCPPPAGACLWSPSCPPAGWPPAIRRRWARPSPPTARTG